MLDITVFGVKKGVSLPKKVAQKDWLWVFHLHSSTIGETLASVPSTMMASVICNFECKRYCSYFLVVTTKLVRKSDMEKIKFLITCFTPLRTYEVLFTANK